MCPWSWYQVWLLLVCVLLLATLCADRKLTPTLTDNADSGCLLSLVNHQPSTQAGPMVSERRVQHQDAFLVSPFGLQEILLMLCSTANYNPEWQTVQPWHTYPTEAGGTSISAQATHSLGRQPALPSAWSFLHFHGLGGLNCVFNFCWLIGLKAYPVAFRVVQVSTATYKSLLSGCLLPVSSRRSPISFTVSLLSPFYSL